MYLAGRFLQRKSNSFRLGGPSGLGASDQSVAGRLCDLGQLVLPL